MIAAGTEIEADATRRGDPTYPGEMSGRSTHGSERASDTIRRVGWAIALLLTLLVGLSLANGLGPGDVGAGVERTSAATGEESEGPAVPSPLVSRQREPGSSGDADRGASADSRSTLDQDELTAMGELGFLPGLVHALAPASDCVFDDALSTCQ